MEKLKLGILGLSKGNGHPYSWSAICNGFDKQYMKDCPFPVIPEYLAQQNYPQDFIGDATVTHIWTQDQSISVHVAKACYIENVVDNYCDMIGQVDGILLARDDPYNHYEMSKPFLEAGLPIYIDKPLATTMKTAKDIYALEQYAGQIFTCSAFRYAKELIIDDAQMQRIGNINYIDACVVKDWETYAVHIIDPVLKIIGEQGQLQKIKKIDAPNTKIVHACWQSGLHALFSVHKNTDCPIMIRLFGDTGYKEIVFEDTFYAFRETLKTFLNAIRTKSNPIKREDVFDVVNLIEKGM